MEDQTAAAYGNIIAVVQGDPDGDGTEQTYVISEPVEGEYGNVNITLVQTDDTLQVLQQENIDPQAGGSVAGQPTVEEIQVAPHIVDVEPEIQPPIGKGPFKCEVCEKVFQKWGQIQRHMKKHEDDKPFRCNECEATFNVEENLRLHEAIHSDDLTCPDCNKKFSRLTSFKGHIMIHLKEENLMCTECGDEFSLQSQLNRHMQEHRDEQEGRLYPCKQCNSVFTKLIALRDHQRQHARKALTKYTSSKRAIDRSGFTHKCSFCNKAFQKPSQLLRHTRIHTGERPYKCPHCDKAFNQKGSMQIHMAQHTGTKPHECTYCPMTFIQKGNLRAHIQRVHIASKGDEHHLYHCEECSCTFKKLGSLNAHISRTHSEKALTLSQMESIRSEQLAEKGNSVNDVIQHLLQLSEQVATNPETAQQQLQQYASSGNVSSDILQQALENSGLTTNVTTTGTSTVSTSTATPATTSSGVQSASAATNAAVALAKVQGITTMTVHDSATGVRKQHVIRKVNGVRWHQCTYCSKEFKKPSDLVRHIRIHTHEKPFKCSQCFRSFAVKSTLTSHLKTHSGVKECKCHVCEKMFSTHGSLKVHLRLHTGAKPYDCPHCDKKFRTAGHRKIHIMLHFKDSTPKKPRRVSSVKRTPKPDIPLPDIALQEPILITDTGLIQQPPRHNQTFTQYLGEAGSVDRPYKCGYCSRAFKKTSHLKQHIRSHTGEKPFKCLQCLRSFVSTGVLKAHIRTHTGLKAYKCLICDSAFTTNGSLKRHMSTHSEIRPFMCPYCQKTFKTSVNCKKHMKTHVHELAMQALQQQNPTAEVQDSQENEFASQHISQEPQNEITLTTELNTTRNLPQTLQPDLNAQTLNLSENLEQQLQQTLNQQILGNQNINQPTLNQNILGQQNFSTFNIQGGNLDLTSLGSTSIGTTLTSTSIQNILQTRDVAASSTPQTRTDDDDGKRVFKCGYCEKAFKKSSHLKQHIRSHTGEKPYKCPQCARMFVSGGVLKAHLKTHTGAKDYRCDTCQATFTTNGSLTRHMVVHSDLRPYKCLLCNETFRTSNNCKKHMKTHNQNKGSADADNESDNDDEDEDMEEVTPPQRRSRSSVVQISDEQAAQLSKAQPKEGSSLSEKILIESAAEKDRVSEIVLDKENELAKLPKHPHQCDLCSKSFKKPSDLLRHKRIHTGEKPFQCTLCQRAFTVKSTLDSHIKTHGPTEKVYKCHVCNSHFSTKGSLKVHMRLHTGAKPFKCPHCEERFRTSGHRKSHIQTHFRPPQPKKPRRNTPAPRTTDTQFQLLSNTTEASGPVVNIDPSLLQQTYMPISLAVDSLGNNLAGDTPMAAQVLQGLEGIQLQLSGNVGQAIQITGLDPNLLTQTVQIDASLLQQLQSQGNINLTINPNLITQAFQAGDSNLLSNVQNDPSNVVVQPINLPTVSTHVASTSDVVTTEAGEGMVHVEVDNSNSESVEVHNDAASADHLELVDNPAGTVINIIPEANQDEGMLDTASVPLGTRGIDGMSGDSDRAHVCDICQKAFKRAGHLREHKETHNPSTQSKQKPTPHQCLTCGKAFAKPSQLERHIRIHTGERPFVCHICNKAFNQKNALQIHLKKHSGEKPYKCPYCQLAFTQKGNLKVHIKRAHHEDMVNSMNLNKDAMSVLEEGEEQQENMDLDEVGEVVTDFFAQ